MFVLLSQVSICLHAFWVDFERKLKIAEEEINGLAKQFMKHSLYCRVHQGERKAVKMEGWLTASLICNFQRL